MRDGALVLEFDEGEELTVYNPASLVLGAATFRIERADRVRWEWYAYDEEKSPSTRYREEGSTVEG